MSLEYGEHRERPLAYLRDNDPDYRDARYLVERWPKNFDFVENASYNKNYDAGSPASQANYEFWKEQYEKTEGKSWWDLGSSGGILVRIQLLSKDELESYEYLEDNYQIDDDRTQEIEQEIQNEAWDDHGRKDFTDAIEQGATDEEERTLIEALLETLPEKAIDSAVHHAWADNEEYPEMEGGWHVRFPDPEKLLDPPHKGYRTSRPQSPQWDGTAVGLIDWIASVIVSGGAETNMIVRLSDKAFCRVSKEDAKTQTWPGATFMKYGEPMALNIKWQDIVDEMGPSPKFKELFDQYADDANVFTAQNAPSIEVPYNRDIYRLPFFTCELKFIADAKDKITGGPAAAWTDETVVTDEMGAEAQKFFEMTAKMRNFALEGALRCNIDPSDDLVEETTAELLWLYRDDLPDPFKEKSYYASKPREEVIMENACDITQRLIAKLPAVCDLRQLKFPFASESQRRKHAQENPISKLSAAQIGALADIASHGGHGYGEYAYLSRTTAFALARKGLIKIGSVPERRGHHRISWAIITQAGADALRDAGSAFAPRDPVAERPLPYGWSPWDTIPEPRRKRA